MALKWDSIDTDWYIDTSSPTSWDLVLVLGNSRGREVKKKVGLITSIKSSKKRVRPGKSSKKKGVEHHCVFLIGVSSATPGDEEDEKDIATCMVLYAKRMRANKKAGGDLNDITKLSSQKVKLGDPTLVHVTHVISTLSNMPTCKQ